MSKQDVYIILGVVAVVVLIYYLRNRKEGFGTNKKCVRVPISDCQADCDAVYFADINGSYDIYGILGKGRYVTSAQSNRQACYNNCQMGSYANY